MEYNKKQKTKKNLKNTKKYSTMDILVPIPMKNAAKCDTQCELQNASHQIFERKWRRLAAGMWGSVCLGNHKSGMWLKGVFTQTLLPLNAAGAHSRSAASFTTDRTSPPPQRTPPEVVTGIPVIYGAGKRASGAHSSTSFFASAIKKCEGLSVTPSKKTNKQILTLHLSSARSPAELKHISKRRKRN
jgi:hypothetical protein